MEGFKDFVEKEINQLTKILLGIICILIIFICVTQISKDEKSVENEVMEELFFDQEQQENNESHLSAQPDEMNVEEVSLVNNDKIIIDVKGAVEAPGVYEMEAESRVIDCIEKAGGFLIEAEQKSVNLAQRIDDQMVIYIPEKGEEGAGIEQLLTTSPVNHQEIKSNTIDINKAIKEELTTLNGIGDSKAENIISYRETNGLFQNIEEVKNVSGIGESTYEKLKEDIHTNP